MVNDDVVKCPLCGGFTHIDKPELLATLHDPKIREQIEIYVAELLRSQAGELIGAVGQSSGRNFNKDVHNWNPNVPTWRRSPKE
jgi:hypothetical protein